ncbi:FGGY-family carbohydrate kinase [Lacisediminihabitans profunda]|uniref:FGGY-family carbohydrate kinase n=1 Tax=Lacisediminihabitans profunda TaxID=2594790 RepID=A0A5C8UTK5_9MICO|nr:FGGY-family carbohydrate kinase [Lacisediminihabitans profunda]TXN31240.1 FGGY-family carbohydrate kinase [Lacisediminihabitans profunda]
MSRYTIGIDLGTTGTKTILLDTEAGIVAQASRESALYSPRPGFAEADPAQWLRNVQESIRQVVVEAGISPRDVVAISASGMVPAVIPVDRAGRPLRRAILQNDARATVEIGELTELLAVIDLVALTGSALTQQSVAPTAAWIQANEPDVWAKTTHLMGSYDWILLALGAQPHVELNWALESGLFGLDTQPLASVLDAAKVERDILPAVLSPGDRAGVLSATAANDCGLIAGTALIVGGADHVLSAFAAGVEKEGDWLVKLGGAGDILVASDRVIVDPRLYLDAHPVPGRWLPNGCMATSGSLIRWYQSLIGGTDLLRLDEEAALRPPADLLCLPYFLGEKSPINDPDLRGTFAGLHLGHTRADLYRSVLEAIAFGFRHNADVFREIGMKLDRVMITNGGSKSTLWKQIHAEVLGTEMYPVLDHPGASLGAALIAAVGVGAISNWEDTKRFLRLGEPVVPDPAKVLIYGQAYQEWLALGSAVAPISHSIARRTRS